MQQYDCPLEPLTRAFWQAKKNARLAYRILLLTSDARAPGDLLILASQDLDATFNQGFGHLTIPQFLSLHRAILRLNFPQVDVLRSLQFEDRLDLFKELETSFAELVLPRKNEKGEYYRRLHKLEAFDNSQTHTFLIYGNYSRLSFAVFPREYSRRCLIYTILTFRPLTFILRKDSIWLQKS